MSDEESGTRTSRLQRADAVLAQKVGDATMLVVPLRQETHVLNEVAARVWELCEGRSIREISAIIAREYDAPIERILDDVRDLTAGMLADGILIETQSSCLE